MSDFFTHLASQAIQPFSDVVPNVPVHFVPGANVPASELAPEPPAIDSLLEPAPPSGLRSSPPTGLRSSPPSGVRSSPPTGVRSSPPTGVRSSPPTEVGAVPATIADQPAVIPAKPSMADPPASPQALAAETMNSNPPVPAIEALPTLPKAEKKPHTAPAAHAASEAPDAETTAPALRPDLPAALPTVSQTILPSIVLRNAGPAARPEVPPVGQPTSAGSGAVSPVPQAPANTLVSTTPPASSLPQLKPLASPAAGRPEPPVVQLTSAGPGIVPPVLPAPASILVSTTHPAGSLPLPKPLPSPETGKPEPPIGQPTSTGLRVVPPVPPPPASIQALTTRLASSLPLLKSLALSETSKIVQPGHAEVNPPAAAFQPQLPRNPQWAGSNFPPEIFPRVKPGAAPTALPQAPLSQPAPTRSSPEIRGAAVETVLSRAYAPRFAEAVSLPTPAAGTPEPVRARPILDETASGQQPRNAQRAERAQVQTTRPPAGLQPASINPANPQPISAGLAVQGEQMLPVTANMYLAAKSEMGSEQPVKPLELNPQSLIRPVLAAELPLDRMALSAQTGADETTAPTVHLTIGRIVVTAAPPAASPASSVRSPAASRRQPAVSLLDYLNRHGSNK